MLGRIALFLMLAVVALVVSVPHLAKADEPVGIKIVTFKSQDCRNHSVLFSRDICTTVTEDENGNLIAYTGRIKYPASWKNKKVYLVPSDIGYEFVLVPEK